MATATIYKPSGIDWLGDIPEGWEVKRLKFLTQFKYGESLNEENRKSDGEFEVYGSNGIIGNHDERITSGTTIVIGRKGSYGKITWVNKSCFPVDTTYYIDETATKNNLRWIYYVLACLKLDEGNQDSAVPGLSRDVAYNKIVPFTPVHEQKSIADFLDRETAKIDEMVEKKQKMMELLKEKRQALITHAVTKGLDPKAKMKRSGIDWLGDIPEGWKIKRLKHIVKTKRGAIKTGPFGSDLTRDDYVFDEENSFAKIYTQQNIIENDLSLGDDYITEEKYLELIACTLEKNDVVLTTRGTLGRSMVFTESTPLGIMHPCLLRVQLDERHCLKEFFQLLIQESHYFFEQLVYISNATTIEVLYGDTLKYMQIALPSIKEQKKILEYVAQNSKRIDERIKIVKTQIEKLQEYRQALIFNTVTGKIRVDIRFANIN